MSFETAARRPSPQLPFARSLLAMFLAASVAAPPGLAAAKRAPKAEVVPSDFAEDEEEEAPAPKKKKKKAEPDEEEAPAPKKRSASAEEVEEEDEAPAPKKKKKKADDDEDAAPKKKKRADAEDGAGTKAKVGLGIPPPAEAAGPVTLAVVGIGDDPRLAETMAAVAESSAARSERFKLLDLTDVFEPGAAGSRATKATDAEKMFRTGKSAFEVDLEMSTAVEFFSNALKNYEAAGFHRHWPAATQAWAYRVAAKIGDGDEGAARVDLEGLLRVDPKRKLDRSLFPPDVLTLAKKVHDDIKGKDAFSLGVSTTPASARVYVDGTYVGASPVELKSIPAGEHFLTLRAPGYEHLQKTVVVRAGAAETVALKATPESKAFLEARGKIAADPRSEERDTWLREIGRAAGAKQVLFLGSWREGGEEVLTRVVRIDVDDGHILGFVEKRLVPTSAEFLRDLDAAVGEALERDSPRGEGGKAVGAAGGGFQWTKKHTGYTALGVGAAAVAGGAFLGLSALSAQDELATTPQPDARVQELVDSTRNQALVADILYGVGVIGAGVFTYFIFLDGPSRRDPAGPTPEEKLEESAPPPAPEEEKKPDPDDPFALLPPAFYPAFAAEGSSR